MQAPGITPTSQAAAGAALDRQIVSGGFILPILYARAVLYRSPALTNVYIQPFYGGYNDAVLGVRVLGSGTR
jgi:hypothetical protein